MYIQRYMHLTGWVFDVNVYTWVYTLLKICIYTYIYKKQYKTLIYMHINVSVSLESAFFNVTYDELPPMQACVERVVLAAFLLARICGLIVTAPTKKIAD